MINRLSIFASFIGLATSVYFLFNTILLLYITCLVAFCLRPMAQFLQKLLKIKWLTALICIGFMWFLLYFFLITFIPALYAQLTQIGYKLDSMKFYLPSRLEQYISRADLLKYTTLIQNTLSDNVNKISGYLLNVISAQGMSLLLLGSKFYLVTVMSFYTLKDWDKFEKLLKNNLPSTFSTPILDFLQHIATSLKHLIQGQLKIALILIAYYSLAFYLITLKHSFLFGTFAGLVSFIPYLGSLISISFTLLYTLNIDPTVFKLTSIILIFFAGNIFESSILVPVFLGQKLRMHPILLICYLISLGSLFGLPGLILSLPTAVIMHQTIKAALRMLIPLLTQRC